MGRESTRIDRGSGKERTTYRSSADHIAWRLPLAPEGIVSPGRHRFPFEFQIPMDALPSYSGTYAKVEYRLTAQLDVPWWPDAVQRQTLLVYFARESIRTFLRPVRFRSGGDGPEIYVELDGNRFFAEERIGCRITLLKTAGKTIRRVYARLVGGEWAQAEGVAETASRVVSEIDIPMGMVRVGEPFMFEVPIPADVPSSYRGKHSYFSYVLHLGLDIAWAADLVAETPIVIVQ